jgi:hypothetical protein
MQTIGQILFNEGQLGSNIFVQETPRAIDLVYSLGGKIKQKHSFSRAHTNINFFQTKKLNLIT